MQSPHLIFYFLFFCMHTSYTTEYVYPIASLHDNKTLLYIHQYSCSHIELFEWDTLTNNSQQILWSIFNPAGLALLPNSSGFSFLDNGRLRIKLFQKRSPQAVDFDEPIYNINMIQWIDEYSCYCSAQQNDHFNIFELHTDGSMYQLITHDKKDLMYPQKVGTHLFYIERSAQKNCATQFYYRIIHAHYPKMPCDSLTSDAELIIDFGNSPIVFLHMRSNIEGFVVEHPVIIDSTSYLTNFLYHHIKKEGDVWHKKLLFSFNIPNNLFVQESEQRLYESILPLVPRPYDNKIYFVSCSKNINSSLKPYVYELSTGKNKKITLSKKKLPHCFVPMQCGKKLYCGGLNHDSESPLISFLT